MENIAEVFKNLIAEKPESTEFWRENLFLFRYNIAKEKCPQKTEKLKNNMALLENLLIRHIEQANQICPGQKKYAKELAEIKKEHDAAK